MKKQSFAVMYAMRELKMRRHTFIPVICIACGVMLLMTNILVYFQCSYTSDLLYYKTETHLILPELSSAEVDHVRQFKFVERVDTVPDGGKYICFVTMKDEYLENYAVYGRCGVQVIEEMRLTDREPYNNYYYRYQLYNVSLDFLRCGMFNSEYASLLFESPILNPLMMFILFLSFLMHLASITLVFGMKIRRSKAEFASMRALGAKMHHLRQINQIEAAGITLVMFIPSLLLSLGTMKLACSLSVRLYPEHDMNSVLVFDVPWAAIALSFVLYLLAAYLGVFIVTRRLKTNSVSELITGTDEKVSFVEKSSARLINSNDFKPYGALQIKRTLRSYIPTQVLFCALIMFPLLLSSFVFAIFQSLDYLKDDESVMLFEFRSDYTLSDERNFVPRTLIDNLLEIDGVTSLRHFEATSSLPYNAILDVVSQYNGLNVSTMFQTLSEVFGDEVPQPGYCFAASELYSVGDKINVSLHGTEYTLEVAETREDMLTESKNAAGYDYLRTQIFISDETLADIYGWDEPMYSYVYVYGERGREEEIIPLIEAAAGYRSTYVNDYERQLREINSYSFTGRAVYIENKINDLYNLFMLSFMLTETLFLLICAGSVIASVTAFEVDGRKNELSVLRALGMEPSSIHKTAQGRQVIGIVIMTVLSYVILYAVMVKLEFDTIEIPLSSKEMIRKELMRIMKTNFTALTPVTIAAMLGYGICTAAAAWKTVRGMLSRPIAENVKNKE